jgi:glycosyltransferase involved in cell wall biosynthesis
VDVDTASELKMWERYDHIVSISEDVTFQFLKKFPSLEDRMVQIPNMLPGKSILSQAEAFSARSEMPEGEEIRFLSIGRFCHAKNFDNLPDILRRIREREHKVHWYIIGYGSGEEDIRRALRESGMEDHVTILGKKENPYPYIKACDYYLQLSRYEGYSVSVREAQLLGKPVIISDYPTAKSQLRDGVDGLIVPLENEVCAGAISGILSEPGLKEKLMSACRQGDYTNRQEIRKLALLME